jgi:hypothetical protein
MQKGSAASGRRKKCRVNEPILFVANQRHNPKEQRQPTAAKQGQGDDEGERAAPEISKKTDNVKPGKDGESVADALVEIDPYIEPDA